MQYSTLNIAILMMGGDFATVTMAKQTMAKNGVLVPAIVQMEKCATLIMRPKAGHLFFYFNNKKS